MINKADNLTILGYLCYMLANTGSLNESAVKLIDTSNSNEFEKLFNRRKLRIYFSKVNSYVDNYVCANMPNDMYCDTVVNLCAKLARSTLYLLSAHSLLSEKGIKILIELQASKDSNIICNLFTQKEYENIFAAHFMTEIKELASKHF